MSNTKVIKSTTNYGMFVTHPYNRDIARTKPLENSMKTYGFDPCFPIRCVRGCSGKLEITHGHHRYAVAMKLGIPVWYVIADAELPLFESETSARAWNVRDFVTARAKAGEEPSKDVIEYHNYTGIPLGTCIAIMSHQTCGGGNKVNSIKKGTFVIKDMDRAARVCYVVDALKEMDAEFATSSNFVLALSTCMNTPEFDESIFVHKANKHRNLLAKQRTKDEYIELIDLIYNRQVREKIPLSFLAKEATKKLGDLAMNRK